MSEDLDGQLPRQELLIKILNMTTSDNDNTALVAIRRANEFLDKNNWSWDKLINGKIKIVEDPFKNINIPQGSRSNYYGRTVNPTRPTAPPPPPPPRPAPPQPAQRPAYNPPPPPPPPQPKGPLGTRSNLYAGHCWCCGDPVDAKSGWMFDPSDHRPYATNQGKLKVVCHSCNTAPYPTIGVSPATRRRTARGAAPSLGDI